MSNCNHIYGIINHGDLHSYFNNKDEAYRHSADGDNMFFEFCPLCGERLVPDDGKRFHVNDVVWFFDSDDKEIKDAIVVGVRIRDGEFYYQLKRNGERVLYYDELYSSREALCEHYRKIFE